MPMEALVPPRGPPHLKHPSRAARVRPALLQPQHPPIPFSPGECAGLRRTQMCRASTFSAAAAASLPARWARASSVVSRSTSAAWDSSRPATLPKRRGDERHDSKGGGLVAGGAILRAPGPETGA